MQIDYSRTIPESKRRKKLYVPDRILPFGKERSAHMFLMDGGFTGNKHECKWSNARIVPYKKIADWPGKDHYGQKLFEGIKAFQHPDSEIYIFRLDQNAIRFNRSARILEAPVIPQQDFIEAVHALVDIDRLWFPQQEGATLYIRPFMYPTEDVTKVRPGITYTFCVFLSPSGPYYPGGFNNPITLLMQDILHRTFPGGVGRAKASANYGASMRPGKLAEKLGAGQVLYLDISNTVNEETGAMNNAYVRDRVLYLPEFRDTILHSITSQSVLDLEERIGIPVRQETISREQFLQQVRSGEISEDFGLGTAAVVSPVGRIRVLDTSKLDQRILEEVLIGDRYVSELIQGDPMQYCEDIIVGDGQVGNTSRKLYELLVRIQTGALPSLEGWLQMVEHKL